MGLLWSFVFKNTNSKHQITNKSQIPISNDQNLPGQHIVLILEFWSLGFVWYLVIGIWNFNNSMKLQQSKSPSENNQRPVLRSRIVFIISSGF